MIEFDTQLLEVVKRTSDVRSYRFTRPEDFSFLAGQFFFVTLDPGSDREQTKHFSFSNSPTEEGFIELTTKLTGSDYKNRLDSLEVGEVIRIRRLAGEFTLGDNRDIVFLSGGVGITPIRSMIKYATDDKLDVDMTLLYGNWTPADIIFRQDLDDMVKQNSRLKVVHTLTDPSPDWSGYTGRIDQELIEKEIPSPLEKTFYLCGPPGMVEAMKNILAGMNVPQGKIKAESFTGY